MKPRAFVTRFGRIVPNSDLPDKYKVPIEDCKGNNSTPIGPKNRKFYTEVLSVGLSCTNQFGSILLYPIRETATYCLSINGKSEICSSNQNIYKKLSRLGFITANVKALFREYRILNLKEISKHIPDSQIIQVEATDCFIRGDDILCIGTDEKINHYLLIPCCFEDKTLVEAFFKTDSLNSKILEKFDEAKLRQFTSCFNISSEIFEELCEKAGL